MTDVLTWTPHTRMVWRSIYRKTAGWEMEIAEEYGVEKGDIDTALYDYAMLCARCPNAEGLDFPIVTVKSSIDEVRTGFIAYLNTAQMARIQDIELTIRQMDAPSDPVASGEDTNGKTDPN